MQNYTKSLRVADGHVVSLRKRKFVRCGQGMTPVGVYSSGDERTTTILETGKVVRSHHPEGVVTFGQVRVQMGGMNEKTTNHTAK